MWLCRSSKRTSVKKWEHLLTSSLACAGGLPKCHTLALENYNGINLSSGTKWGLTDSIGQLSHMLFGNTMKEDVLNLREKFNHLTSFTSVQSKLIHLNSRNTKRFEQQVQDSFLHQYLGVFPECSANQYQRWTSAVLGAVVRW